MWKRKWLIFGMLLPVLIIGGISGVALASSDSEDTVDPEAQYEAMLNRVCEIYEENTGVALDSEQLNDAFAQARDEMQTEALESWLQDMVDEGEITQEEADQYLEWWQARPDIGLQGPMGQGFGGGMMGGRGHHHWGGGPGCGADDSSETGV